MWQAIKWGRFISVITFRRCYWQILSPVLARKKAKYALNLRGFTNAPICNVRLDRCRFDSIAWKSGRENVEARSESGQCLW
jgi:hypothetical protein